MKGIKLNFLCFQRFKTCGASALKIHWRGRNDVNWRKVFDLGGTSLVFIQPLDFADMEKQEQEGKASSPDCVIKRRSFVQVNSGWNIAFWDDSLAWAWAIGFEARRTGFNSTCMTHCLSTALGKLLNFWASDSSHSSNVNGSTCLGGLNGTLI